jgi:hypothetical protein
LRYELWAPPFARPRFRSTKIRSPKKPIFHRIFSLPRIPAVTNVGVQTLIAFACQTEGSCVRFKRSRCLSRHYNNSSPLNLCTFVSPLPFALYRTLFRKLIPFQTLVLDLVPVSSTKMRVKFRDFLVLKYLLGYVDTMCKS